MKITGVGVAVSTGDEPMPWPVRASAVSRRYRPAAALAEVVHHALGECGARGPIVLASCNGKVTTWSDDDWRASFDLADIVDARDTPAELDGRPPARVLGRAVASSQCASGMHALYIARSLLAAGHPEVTVLAVDIASAPAHDNFEALRVLTDEPAPYTERSAGFQLGEAAVALRVAADGGVGGLVGPVLGTDLDGEDALERCLGEVLERKMRTFRGLPVPAPADRDPQLVVGQGAGPAEADRVELAGIARHLPLEVPIATALARAGHTLGASSLLSVAAAIGSTIGAATMGTDTFTRDLVRRLLVPSHALDVGRTHAPPVALDGRAMTRGTMIWRAAAVTRSLGGACGAVIAGDVIEKPVPARCAIWGPRSAPPALRDEALRRIAADADAQRPARPPDLLVVTLECPLPPAARIGQRILPTSVLEMTPGFIPQLVARAWGFRGAALCLVGVDPEPLLAALRSTHERVFHVAIRGMHERHVEWIPRG